MTTIAEETWTILREWYFSRGLKVPDDEEKICKDEIAKEAKERLQFEACMTRNLLKDELEMETDYTKKAEILKGIAACEAMIKPVQHKPAYGSPEFWKEHWAKKKASGWTPKSKKNN